MSVADLFLMDPRLGLPALVLVFVVGFLLAALSSGRTGRTLALAGAGLLLALVLAWVTAFFGFPDFGAKDGTGGAEAVQRGDAVLFRWVLVVVAAYAAGIFVGAIRGARTRQ